MHMESARDLPTPRPSFRESCGQIGLSLTRIIGQRAFSGDNGFPGIALAVLQSLQASLSRAHGNTSLPIPVRAWAQTALRSLNGHTAARDVAKRIRLARGCRAG